jgi:hypothetical protein
MFAGDEVRAGQAIALKADLAGGGHEAIARFPAAATLREILNRLPRRE